MPTVSGIFSLLWGYTPRPSRIWTTPTRLLFFWHTTVPQPNGVRGGGGLYAGRCTTRMPTPWAGWRAMPECFQRWMM